MMLVTNVFLEIVSEVLVFQIQIEKEKWKAVKGFCKISVIYDCVCQSDLNVIKLSIESRPRRVHHPELKVCVILLIPLSCCLPEQLVSNVFKTHVQLIKRMERLRKHLSLKRWVLLKVGYIRLLYMSTVSGFNLITWLIEISLGRTYLIQMLHLGIYILDNSL